MRVVKNNDGYSVEINGEVSNSIFKLKKDALVHMKNLKQVQWAIIEKLENLKKSK